MDLRVRLTVLLALIFAATLAAGSAWLLADVRIAVRDELAASSDLATTLLQGVIDLGPAEVDAGHVTAIAARLTRDAAIRHLRFEVLRDDARLDSLPAPRAAVDGAPAWFAALVRPDPAEFVHLVPYAGGRIVVLAEPDDEVAEAWRETRTTLTVVLALCVGALLLVFLFLGRALRPLRELSQALVGIERGQFGTRVPAIGLADIDTISARYNHMADALAASHADNLALTERSLEIQEQERRHLARELHDEMGQSITAIKALAVSIRERAAANEPTLAERAATITDVSSDIYARVRRMIARLHPVVLDELGLVAALEQMVDDWNSYHAECFCRLDVARDLPPLSPAARIGLYRIAQEGLTNVARHAGANSARLTLRLEAGAAGETAVVLEIVDDGRGFEPASRRRGLGLSGIAERAETLGGAHRLDSAAGGGARLQVRLPLAMLAEKEAELA